MTVVSPAFKEIPKDYVKIGGEFTDEYEWVIQHPDRRKYFLRWRGIFKKEPVWTDNWRRAARYKSERQGGPGTEAMIRFRDLYSGCSCRWPIPRIIILDLVALRTE